MDLLYKIKKAFSHRGSYPDVFDVLEAEARWRHINEVARESGCKCGKPATHVRRIGGNMGSVSIEIWSCEQHVNVNGWTRNIEDEYFTPMSDFSTEFDEFLVHGPRREQ